MEKRIGYLSQGAGGLLTIILLFVMFATILIVVYLGGLTIIMRATTTQILAPASYYASQALLADQLWHYRWGKSLPQPGEHTYTFGDATVAVVVEFDAATETYHIRSNSNVKSSFRSLEASIKGTPIYIPLHVVMVMDASGSTYQDSQNAEGGASCSLLTGCPTCLFRGAAQHKPNPGDPSLCEPFNANRQLFRSEFLEELAFNDNPKLKLGVLLYSDEARRISFYHMGTTAFDGLIENDPATAVDEFNDLYEQLGWVYPSGYTNLQSALLTAQAMLEAEPVSDPPARRMIVVATDLDNITKSNTQDIYNPPPDYSLNEVKKLEIRADTQAAAQAAKDAGTCIVGYSGQGGTITGTELEMYNYFKSAIISSPTSSTTPEWCIPFDGLYLPEGPEPGEVLERVAEDINSLNAVIDEVDPEPEEI